MVTAPNTYMTKEQYQVLRKDYREHDLHKINLTESIGDRLKSKAEECLMAEEIASENIKALDHYDPVIIRRAVSATNARKEITRVVTALHEMSKE